MDHLGRLHVDRFRRSEVGTGKWLNATTDEHVPKALEKIEHVSENK